MQQSCKQTLEISIPADEVAEETNRVVASLAQRVRVPGFRPGKVPAAIVRARFAGEVREEVIRNLVPRVFQKRVEDENLQVVGTPDISDVRYEEGQPLTFKADFEVAPDIELKEYRGLTVAYREPEVAGADVERRLEELREQKAEFVNVDPRPLADGDYAVVLLEALEGLAEPRDRQDELTLHIGGEETLEAFSENLRGLAPGEQKEFDVPYPGDYGDPKLAGRTVRFRAAVKGLRSKELPELNDDFARDLGDFQTLDELRAALKQSIARENAYLAQREAQNKLVETLVDTHDFPVPEAYIERQIESQVEQYLRTAAARGVDPASLRFDWEKLKESQRDKALREVKASLLLGQIADREGIVVTNEEVDREVQRIARQEREPVAAVRKRLEKEGVLRRIASHIRTEKTLNFLFEHARKIDAG